MNTIRSEEEEEKENDKMNTIRSEEEKGQNEYDRE